MSRLYPNKYNLSAQTGNTHTDELNAQSAEKTAPMMETVNPSAQDAGDRGQQVVRPDTPLGVSATQEGNTNVAPQDAEVKADILQDKKFSYDWRRGMNRFNRAIKKMLPWTMAGADKSVFPSVSHGQHLGTCI